MPYPIERKLVVGVSSNALFNLEKEEEIFQKEGLESFRKYQLKNKRKILEKGMAFPFVRRFLNINNVYKDESPVEVVLLSKNSPETGIRIFNSIKEYRLPIVRAAFTSGQSPIRFIPAYNISLFLSTNENDVQKAINACFAAGRILKTEISDDEFDNELRVAFDFDGVIADDEAEKIYKTTGDLDQFIDYEVKHTTITHNPGPLADFFRKLSFFQKLETKKQTENTEYQKLVKTSIITARSAPAHERTVNTLHSWGVTVDDLFLLGGIEKKRVLEILKPHLFFDDQVTHLNSQIKNIPLVHIPFGIANVVKK